MSKPAQNVICVDEAAMQALGGTLLSQLSSGSLVTLSGELGTGKSVLARAIIHAAGYEGRVKSPTYTLIESYDIDKPTGVLQHISHLDLYRLADPNELHYLGFDDVLAAHDLVLIEWPEKAQLQLPEATLRISIDYMDAGARKVLIESSV